MRIIKRFYALITILLFLSISYLFLVAERGSKNVSDNSPKHPSKELNRFIKQLFPGEEKSEIHITKLKIPFTGEESKNVLEIDEVNVHQVSLIYKQKGNLKAINWFKCEPSQLVALSTNPFFILNQEILNSEIILVYNGSPLKIVPIKLYGYNDFFIRKANQDTAKTIIVLALVIILLISLFIYFTIRSFYSILFSVYILFCLISNLVYSGFANNFWPFNVPYISDHFLGFSLSVHILSMSYFLVYLVGKKERTICYYITYLTLVISTCFLIGSTVLESFILLKYQLVFAFTLCLIFAIYYPKMFHSFKKKDAYWSNYIAILCFILLFVLSSAKYFNIISPNIILYVSIRILFLGHILSLFFAFLLITKSRFTQQFNQTFNTDKESDDRKITGNESLSEILATLSEREYIVLELLSIGLKDQEISEKLSVSITTVKTHKQKIYRKLNINNRIQATQIFLKFTSKTMNFINN